MLARILFASTLLASFSHPVQAQSFNIDLRGAVTYGTPGTGLRGPACENGYWNDVEAGVGGTIENLDQTSTAIILFPGGGSGATASSGGLNDPQQIRLLEDFFLVDGDYDIQIIGLTPGDYEVAAIAWHPMSSQNPPTNKTRVTIGSNPTRTCGGGFLSGFSWSIPKTYDWETVTVTGGGVININVKDTATGVGALNAIQLRPKVQVGTTYCLTLQANMSATGSASKADNNLIISIDNVAPADHGAPAAFLVGTSAIQNPFGNGWWCVGNSTRVLAGFISPTHLALPYCWDNNTGPAGGWSVGQTLYMQGVYRLNAGGWTTTDGLMLTLAP